MALFVSGTCTANVQQKLQHGLNILYQWLALNKLSVNCDKSNIMLFTSSRFKYKNDVISANMSGKQIQQTKEVKYLGLFFDHLLSFNSHITKVCSKINVRTKLMWRIRHFISKDLAFTLYKSLIEPHLQYCNFILEGTSQANLQKLQVQQNNAVRSVCCVEGNYSGTQLRKELHVDSVIALMQECMQIRLQRVP